MSPEVKPSPGTVEPLEVSERSVCEDAARQSPAIYLVRVCVELVLALLARPLIEVALQTSHPVLTIEERSRFVITCVAAIFDVPAELLLMHPELQPVLTGSVYKCPPDPKSN